MNVKPPNLTELRFNETINVEVNEFVALLALSFSLDLSEKRRVLDSISTLSRFQVNSLINVFKDEQRKFELLNEDHPGDVSELIAKSREEWGLLQQFYKLPDFTEPDSLLSTKQQLNLDISDLSSYAYLPRFSPNELMDIASKKIIGQSHAVKTLSSTLYYHSFQAKKCITSKAHLGNQQFRQAPILLSGGSGTGKTYILTTLTKLMDIPTLIVDASTIVPAGIVGLSISSVGKRIIDNANGNIDKARFSVVVLDEFDKLLSTKSDIGVLFQLLTLLGGTAPIFLDSDKERDNNIRYPKQLDCSNILFMLAGSFYIQKKQTSHNTIGFCKSLATDNTVNQEFLSEIEIPPELRGRIGKTITLNSPTEDELQHIFFKSPSSPFISVNQQLNLIGCRLRIRPETLNSLISNSQSAELGARGLFQQFLALPELEHILFDAPCKQGEEFYL